MVRGRVEQVDAPEAIYGEPATPFVATFVGTANLVHAEIHGGFATTRLGSVRLIRRGQDDGRHGLAVIRPEHVDIGEAPDGPADSGAWRVARRRFAGTEILYEVVAPDGTRLWVEAGQAVRRLRLGDAVTIRLHDVETVVFPAGASTGSVAESLPTPPVVSPR